jgi:hypothetical protein
MAAPGITALPDGQQATRLDDIAPNGQQATRRVHAAGWRAACEAVAALTCVDAGALEWGDRRADAPRGLLRLPAANARAVAIYVALEAGVDRAVIARTAGLALPTLRFASQRVGDSAGKNPCLSEALGEAMTAVRAAMRAAAAAELHGLG